MTYVCLSLLAAFLVLPAFGDEVTFITKTWPCSLWVQNQKVVQLSIGVAHKVDLPARQESLVECYGTALTPVPLYSRQHIGYFGPSRPGPNGNNLPDVVEVFPVAVLENAVKAARQGKLEVRVTGSKYADLRCNSDDSVRSLPENAVVKIVSDQIKNCKHTNFVRIEYNGKQEWHGNRDFSFYFDQKLIDLYSMSRDYEHGYTPTEPK